MRSEPEARLPMAGVVSDGQGKTFCRYLFLLSYRWFNANGTDEFASEDELREFIK